MEVSYSEVGRFQSCKAWLLLEFSALRAVELLSYRGGGANGVMTNVQFLLSVGLPSFLVVLSWISNHSRQERTEKRLDDLISSTNKRFDDLSASTHRDALEILRSMTALHERVVVVEARQAS